MKTRVKILILIIGLILLLLFLPSRFMNHSSWKPWSLPLSGKMIILDPGHGHPDSGAIGGDVLEKDITLKVANKLRDYLQQQGAIVQLIREEDTDLAPKDMKGYSKRKVVDLKKRLEIINDSDADLFISIHLNAIPSAKWRGAQTFYHFSLLENEKIAKFIQDEFRNNLGNTTREAKPLNSIYLLRYAKKPGALVEIGFLSNIEERNLLATDEYQTKVAAAIYTGVSRYFSNEKNPPN